MRRINRKQVIAALGSAVLTMGAIVNIAASAAEVDGRAVGASNIAPELLAGTRAVEADVVPFRCAIAFQL